MGHQYRDHVERPRPRGIAVEDEDDRVRRPHDEEYNDDEKDAAQKSAIVATDGLVFCRLDLKSIKPKLKNIW